MSLLSFTKYMALRIVKGICAFEWYWYLISNDVMNRNMYFFIMIFHDPVLTCFF